MKRQISLLLIAAAGLLQGAVAENVSRTFYIDFGDVNEGRGHETVGADVNGHYWNNVKSSGNNYIYPGTVVPMVTSANEPTSCSVLVNVRFMTNGMGAGGLNTPSADLLGDLAVTTATEDYLFIEDFQDYNYFTFRGLDLNKAYRFHAFGSRANNATRIGNYSFRGLNEWNENHQMAGEGCGADGYNGNNNHISVSDPIFPDENGNITFTISRVQGMLHINAMKIEEIDGVERPDNFRLSQAIYIDFGESKTAGGRDHGHETEGADVNGHYWNNIVCTSNDVIPANSQFALVNASNEPSGITATTMQYLKTNGLKASGGLENPKAEYLRDLAIPSATEDYFYVELSQKTASIEFTGVNPDKAYRISAFGSRCTNETGDRWAYFRVDGNTSWRTRQDFSGRCIGGRYDGGGDYHGNTMNVAVSDFIFPDANGKLTFTIEQQTGLAHLNVLKLEEFDATEAPEPVVNVMTLAVTGSAVEDGGDVAMTPLSPTGAYTGVFTGYLSLKAGEYSFKGVTDGGEDIILGDADGELKAGGTAYQVTEPQIVRLTADTRNHTLTVLPITSLNVKGSIVPDGTTLDYAGRGVWRSTVALDKNYSGEYINRNIYFAFNNNDALAVKRVAGSHSVAMPSQGYAGENIRLNRGTYEITLDMGAGVFEIDAEVNPYRVSVFGSSVANGQGASNFQGYAYLYGKQLEKRTADGESAYPLHISGVSIGGNTTRNLLDRYDDMLHDFGHYVMIGLSLGNEGIHGAANPENVFAGFRDNMLTLIAQMRADGKEPVVVNNYTRGDYNDADYGYVKRMNMLIHEWDLPSVNVLGAIDDGAGHWAEGFIADVAHPNLQGHNEFMYAIVPSLFDALVVGKPLPERDMTGSYSLTEGKTLAMTGEGTVHPFTISLRVKGNDAGYLMKFEHGARKQYSGSLVVNADGSITYNSPLKDPVTIADAALADGDWHDVTLTHFYAMGKTFVYIDGVLKGEVTERLTLGEVVIGDAENAGVSRDISEVSFWRSGMNAEELAAHHAGKMLKSSLEIYAPMHIENYSFANKAQSMNELALIQGSAAGIGAVEGTAAMFRAEGGSGVIRISGKASGPVTVCRADGAVVAKVDASEMPMEIAAAPGVYLVNNFKVVVR